jgi:spermidine dehydrogenase
MGRKRAPTSPSDSLGMGRRIARRDFLQGALLASATTLSGSLLRGYAAELPDGSAAGFTGSGGAEAQNALGYYPPALTGLRGSHAGSFEDAHALRDGKAFKGGADTGESYDLVVVGAGISGLSAAHFFRSRSPAAARILLLDNHDDFGGHAKRNEFTLDNRLQLLNGGTLGIDSPRPYAAVPEALIRELGIDVPVLKPRVQQANFYRSLGLKKAVFLDRETFGADRLLVGSGSGGVPIAQLLADAPLSARARREIEQLESGSVDYLPGLSSAQKKDRLSRMSYAAFLRDVVKVDPSVVAFYQQKTHGEWAVGIDAVSALDCWAFDSRETPGFQGMQLEPGSIARMGYTPSGYQDTGGSASLHFPDGNATIARLLVRRLIPAALPGNTLDDLITARADYGRLDRPGPVRLRLNSTVVRVRHAGSPTSAREVEVTYISGGRLYSVRARNCVLACWNMMIPYLCPELPQSQKNALHQLVKAPLVYSSVALRNWEAFSRLGVWNVYAPGGYHYSFILNWKVDIGAYRSPRSPQEPILVHMTRTPCQPGLPEHEQNKAGRADLLRTPFSVFEQNIREQLGRTLSQGGFDPARDIQAITVNRWPHGYAPEYNPLWDPEVPPEQRWNVIGRARFGRIAIANSDSGAAAYTDCAILQADRAVNELLQG